MSFRDWTVLRWASLLAGIYVLSFVNVYWPVLRFTTPALNYSFFAMTQLIPWGIAVLATRLKGWRGWTLGITAIAFAILGTPLGLISAGCAVETMRDGRDRIFERTLTVPSARGSVVFYHADTGAVGADGLAVRQQCALLPGILVVRELIHYEDRTFVVQAETADSTTVRVVLGQWGNDGRVLNERIFRLALLPCLWSWDG